MKNNNNNQLMRKLLIALLFFFSALANADNNQQSFLGEECQEYLQESVNIATNQRIKIMDKDIAKKCMSQIYTQTLEYKATLAINSEENIVSIYNILTDFKATVSNLKDTKFVETIKKLKILLTSFLSVVSILAIILFAYTLIDAIAKHASSIYNMDKELGNFRKPIFLAIIAIVTFPFLLGSSLLQYIFTWAAVFGSMAELLFVLLVAPNIFASYYSNSGDSVNASVRNNADYNILETVVQTSLKTAKCEDNNKSRIIYSLAKTDDLRSRVIAESVQDTLACFNNPVAANLTAPGNRAYNSTSNAFNQCYTQITGYSVDCGFIEGSDKEISAFLAGFTNEINSLYKKIKDYDCVVNKDSANPLKNNQMYCIDIDDKGNVIKDGEYAALIKTHVSLDEIKSDITDLTQKIRSQIESKFYQSKSEDLKKLLIGNIELIKNLSAGALPSIIFNATTNSPTYSDYLNVFDKYKAVYSQKERDNTYAESLDNGQTNSETFFIAKQDSAINKIIDMKIFEPSSTLDSFVQQNSFACLQNNNNTCNSVTQSDISNIQNTIIRNISTVNNISWTVKVVSLIDPKNRGMWSGVSLVLFWISMLSVIALLFTMCLAPAQYGSKKLSQIYGMTVNPLVMTAALADLSITIAHDNESQLGKTTKKLSGIFGTFINIMFEKFLYAVCWTGCLTVVSTLFISVNMKLLSFEADVSLANTMFVEFTTVAKLFAGLIVMIFAAIIMYKAPDYCADYIYSKILEVNREVGDSNKITGAGESWFKKAKNFLSRPLQ